MYILRISHVIIVTNQIDSLSINGDTSIGCAGGCLAPVDSGTSTFLAPFAEAERIANLVGAIQILPGIGEWALRSCADMAIMPDLVFNINGVDYPIPPEDYVLKVPRQVVPF